MPKFRKHNTSLPRLPSRSQFFSFFFFLCASLVKPFRGSVAPARETMYFVELASLIIFHYAKRGINNNHPLFFFSYSVENWINTCVYHGGSTHIHLGNNRQFKRTDFSSLAHSNIIESCPWRIGFDRLHRRGFFFLFLIPHLRVYASPWQIASTRESPYQLGLVSLPNCVRARACPSY